MFSKTDKQTNNLCLHCKEQIEGSQEKEAQQLGGYSSGPGKKEHIANGLQALEKNLYAWIYFLLVNIIEH